MPIKTASQYSVDSAYTNIGRQARLKAGGINLHY